MTLPDMSHKVGESLAVAPGSPAVGPMAPGARVVAVDGYEACRDGQGEQGEALAQGGGVAKDWEVRGPGQGEATRTGEAGGSWAGSLATHQAPRKGAVCR